MKRLIFVLLVSLPSWAACSSSWANGYTFCQPVTVQASQITGTLSNFTADVCFGSSINSNCLTNSKQFATVANGGNLQNGADFNWYSDNAGTTPVKFCTVLQNTTSGVAQFKLKATLAVGTEIYFFTGKSGGTDQQDCSNTGDANTLGCWSFPDGTTLSGVTSCGSLALTNNGATATTGKLDGGFNNNYLQQTSTSALQFDNTTPMTVIYWLNFNNSVTGTITIFNNLHIDGTFRGYEVAATGPSINDRTQFLLINTVTSNWIALLSALHFETGPLKRTVVTYDGSQTAAGVKFYFDGALDPGPYQVVGDNLSATTINGQPTFIGRRPDGSQPIGVSIVDELVVSNVVRSPAWIAADFNVESNNAAFWALGTQVSQSTGVQRHH